MSSTKQSNSESGESKSYFNRDFWIKISFVAISALLWFLTKLSQDDYTDQLQYRIEFQNQQTGKVISDVSTDAFNIEVEGNEYFSDKNNVGKWLKNSKGMNLFQIL